MHLRDRPHNPFDSAHTSPDAAAYLFASDAARDALIRRIADAGWTAELVADHGRGKSTLMTALLAEAEARGLRTQRIFVNEDAPRLPHGWKRTLRHADVLGIDGAEVLSSLALWRLKRACRLAECGLLATAHHPLGFATSIAVETTPSTFALFVEQLLADEDVALDHATVEALFRRHHANAREAIWELYMEWERDLLARFRLAGEGTTATPRSHAQSAPATTPPPVLH